MAEKVSRHEKITVAVTQGFLEGRIRKISENLGQRRYFSFQGIPYAEPPIGELRFKAPMRKKTWRGVRDASKTGPCSVQYVIKDNHSEVIGDEDCLYLNVYVPGQLETFQLLPVMFWIHGGGFLEGGGGEEMFGPDYFMRNGNIILVTINYRLGPLGFMYLGTEKVPGNAGLKDQLLALRWVRDNILRFRGDPENITIFGESAGGASVHYLLMSPESRGLFKKAILQSGAVTNPWAHLDKIEAKARTMKLVRTLGCISDEPNVVAECLQKVSAVTLTEKKNEALDDTHRLMKLSFVPISEGKNRQTENNAFLANEPKEILKKGSFHKVPILIGGCRNEGQILNFFFNADSNLLTDVDKDFSLMLPKVLLKHLETEPEKKKEVIEKIRKFYFKDKPINEETYPILIDLCTDIDFMFGIKQVVDNFLLVAPDYPIYLYMFDYEGSFSFVKKIVKNGKSPIVNGASHIDELGYLFKMKKYFEEPEPDSTDFKVMDMMVNIWTEFAINGEPPKNLNVDWQPYNLSYKFLKIDSTLSLEEDFFKDRLSFWQELYHDIGLFICGTN